MAQVRIKTLTPVHIGSGNQLQYNSDFIEVTDLYTKERLIQIIDIRKILELIGVSKINDWLLSIEKRESTKDFIKRIVPHSDILSFSKRRMKCDVKNISVNETLKECIHNGFGVPYIPGSSLKGAIRTAVFSSLVDDISEKEKKVFVKGQVCASELEKELFGGTPNTDSFRFIHVGDAFFDRNSEMVLRLMMYLNINKSSSLRSKNDMPQLIEAIAPNKEAICQLDIKRDYYNFVHAKYPEVNMCHNISNTNDLFRLINAHTRKLVQGEVDMWTDLNKTHSDVGMYIHNMETILNEINNCQDGKECILRLGQSSGWRFVTGAWGEALSNFKDVLAAFRPNNSCYVEYDFPKSRKTSENGKLLGFVKLYLE